MKLITNFSNKIRKIGVKVEPIGEVENSRYWEFLEY